MRAQRIGFQPFDDPADVVRWMGAMQAQDYGQSLWAVASRLRRPSLDAVLAAVEQGRILRTWPMRGTIHWVPAEDAAWMVGLSGARTMAAARTRQARLELDEATRERARSVLVAELSGGRRLSRPDVMALWTAAGISVDGQRGYHLLWSLAHQATIAIGPMDGKQQTFVLLEEWAPAARQLSRTEALAELANRYLQSHQPATVRDFAWWAGITLGDARAGCAATTFAEMSGRELLVAEPLLPLGGAGVQLLAGFDEFVLGYQRRGDVLDPEFADRVVPGNNGIFQPCVVADGLVVGTWKRVLRKAAVDVSAALFVDAAAVADISAAADRYAGFLGLPLGEVSVTAVK